MWADGNGKAKAIRISLLFAISATKNVADALARISMVGASWGRAGAVLSFALEYQV
jgi:hypothetical protein